MGEYVLICLYKSVEISTARRMRTRHIDNRCAVVAAATAQQLCYMACAVLSLRSSASSVDIVLLRLPLFRLCSFLLTL